MCDITDIPIDAQACFYSCLNYFTSKKACCLTKTEDISIPIMCEAIVSVRKPAGVIMLFMEGS